ncbi:MAG: M28 family peptidase [Oscillospiraceae bacterium]|nr:M28 family peptidase [Oscillospiraceae bacterium]
MTANQRITNYPAKLREYTNYAVRGIKKVCDECGPRLPATPAELKSQQMMQQDLDACCEETRLESFKSAPRGFMGWVRLVVVLGLAAAVFYFFNLPIVSTILLAAALFTAVMEFLLYKEFIDPFLPKKTSQNLIAVQKPTGEVKRRLILCGHADSVYEWTFFRLADKLNFPPLGAIFIASTLGVVLFGLVISIIGIVQGQSNHVLRIIFLAVCPMLVACWFFENRRKPVLGANDNLTGCYVPMALARMLHETDNRLENTELIIMCSGSEESGLRGAKDFAKRHKEAFQDVETLFIGVDTMTDFDHMAVMITDRTNTVKHDPAAAAMMKKAARTAGYEIPYRTVFFGASDAAATSAAGMRSVAFAAMDPGPPSYYHTCLDTPDALQPKTMEACLKILTETAFEFDAAGLTPFEGETVKAEKGFAKEIDA